MSQTIMLIWKPNFQYVVEDIFEYLHAKLYANLSRRIALTMFAAKWVKLEVNVASTISL